MGVLAVEQRAKIQDTFWEWGKSYFFILGNWETILFILGEQGYHPEKAPINMFNFGQDFGLCLCIFAWEDAHGEESGQIVLGLAVQ